MITQKAIDIFNILRDTYGSPYVNSDEAVDLLNMATYEWLNRLVPSNLGGVVNFELDANTLTNIKPLIFRISVNVSGSVIATNSAITTALQTAGAETGTTWYRIIGDAWDSSVDRPIKFRKHNEFFKHELNYFKKSDESNKIFIITQAGLDIYPKTEVGTVLLTVIKNPRALSLVGPINPELDDQNMYSVIAIALKLSGIAIRDEELIMDVRNTAVQIAQ